MYSFILSVIYLYTNYSCPQILSWKQWLHSFICGYFLTRLCRISVTRTYEKGSILQVNARKHTDKHTQKSTHLTKTVSPRVGRSCFITSQVSWTSSSCLGVRYLFRCITSPPSVRQDTVGEFPILDDGEVRPVCTSNRKPSYQMVYAYVLWQGAEKCCTFPVKSTCSLTGQREN